MLLQDKTLKDVHILSFNVSYNYLIMQILDIFINCIIVMDKTCILFWDVLTWEKDSRWLDHDYDVELWLDKLLSFGEKRKKKEID